jgi:NhaP-type Na+/H+ or K+/H+ antiporter
MNWKNIIIGIAAVIFLARFLWFYYNSRPSDKYHNNSWKKRKNR